MENENQTKKESKLTKKQKKILAAVAGVVVVAVAGFAIAGGTRKSQLKTQEQVYEGDKSKVIEQDKDRENTYIIGASQIPTSSKSYLQAMEGAKVINELVYPGLAENVDGCYEYLLADKVSFSDNGKSASVTLSSKAVFSDGCKITADDVIYTLQYLLNAEVAYDEQQKLWCIEGAEDYYTGNAESISGIEKVSDSQVKITFKEESIDNLFVFTIPMLHPDSHEYETVNLETENLGAGSYKVESILAYEEAVLVKNEYGKESVEYQTIKVVTADLSKLKEQSIDTMIIPTTSLDEIKELGAYDIYSIYGDDRDFLLFNLDEETMADASNRTKLAEALDREELFEKCYEEGRLSYGVTDGTKESPNYQSMTASGKSADGLEIVVPGTYSGTEMAVLDEVKSQLEKAGATLAESGDSAVTYYYGRVEDVISGWDLSSFYENLDGKTLTEVGDLLEKCVVEEMYAIPLHNACYYKINLCNKMDLGLLDN